MDIVMANAVLDFMENLTIVACQSPHLEMVGKPLNVIS